MQRAYLELQTSESEFKQTEFAIKNKSRWIIFSLREVQIRDDCIETGWKPTRLVKCAGLIRAGAEINKKGMRYGRFSRNG